METTDKRVEHILTTHANILLRNVSIISVLFHICAFLFCSIPLYRYVALGTLLPLLPHKFPFTNFDTVWGFTTNSIIHMIMTWCTVMPLLGNDCTFAMILCSFECGEDLIKHNFIGMENDLQHGEFRIEQKQKLRNMLLQTQDMEMYGFSA